MTPKRAAPVCATIYAIPYTLVRKKMVNRFKHYYHIPHKPHPHPHPPKVKYFGKLLSVQSMRTRKCNSASNSRTNII